MIGAIRYVQPCRPPALYVLRRRVKSSLPYGLERRNRKGHAARFPLFTTASQARQRSTAAPYFDATVTVGYPDGQETQIGFQQSGNDVEQDLLHADYIAANGTTSWTQAAYLNPRTVFRIVSATMAQANDPFKPFEGGQAGAYVFGFLRGISTDAPLSAGSSSAPALTTKPPPLLTGGAGSSSNIHAVVISGLSDPAKVIVSPNVTLTGGIVALGKAGSPPSTSSVWSPGLKIIPDYALLTGEKIPPVTPNIIDLRIVRQEVTADFSAGR